MTTYLILSHRPLPHIAIHAARHPQAHYYIHHDAKSPSLTGSLTTLPNVHLISHRIRVNWGGFTMIEATLALIQAALANSSTRHYHLISGDCAMLQSPQTLAAQCQTQPENTLWLHSQPSPQLRYRTRFNAPHADTAWQRSLIGKLLTRSLKIADRILPSRQICLAGSQWFSANRTALKLLFDHSLGDNATLFEKKLVPDEHFFQHIAHQLAGSLNHINANHRHIRFAQGANHPDTLSLDELWAAKKNGAWFARKVSPENQTRWLQYEQDV